MKLDELRPGDVFRSPNGALWVVLDGIGGGGKRRYQLLGPRGGLVVTTPGNTPVEPLDLSALLEGHERVRKLEEALRGLLADAEAAEEYWHGTDPAEVLPSVLAARAALGTK
jgi:hypothetical protein